MNCKFKGTKRKWEFNENKDYPTTHEIWSNHTYIARTCFAPSSKANALLMSKALEMLNSLQDEVNFLENLLKRIEKVSLDSNLWHLDNNLGTEEIERRLTELNQLIESATKID